MALTKTHLVDHAHWGLITAITVIYFVCAIACLGAGGAGPSSFGSSRPTVDSSSLQCPDPRDCTISITTTLSGLDGYNQAIWVDANMQAPAISSTVPSTPAFTYQQQYTVSAVGIGSDGAITPLAANVTKLSAVDCFLGGASGSGGPGGGGRARCSSFTLFRQAFIWYPSYRITASFVNPLKPWVDAGLINTTAYDPTAAAPLNVTFSGGYVSKAYTSFQINAKYTFLAFTTIMLGVFVGFLAFGRGGFDPRDGRRLPMSTEQKFALVLGIGLWWYNDPFVALNVTAPTFALSGFYAFCATSFVAALMLYWLVTFDSARTVSGSTGDFGSGPTAKIATRCHCTAVSAALFFWIPKVVWISVSWVLVIGYYLILRGSWLADPTFDLFTTVPFIRVFFVSFLGAWGAFYVITLFFLILWSFCFCRVMTLGGRLMMLVTLVSIITVLAGYFDNSVLPANAGGSTIGFMASYGIANAYVWFLMVMSLPSHRHNEMEMRSLSLEQAAVAAASGQGMPKDAEARAAVGGDAAPYGGIASGSSSASRRRSLDRAAPAEGSNEDLTGPQSSSSSSFGASASSSLAARVDSAPNAVGSGGLAVPHEAVPDDLDVNIVIGEADDHAALAPTEQEGQGAAAGKAAANGAGQHWT